MIAHRPRAVFLNHRQQAPLPDALRGKLCIYVAQTFIRGAAVGGDEREGPPRHVCRFRPVSAAE